MKEEQYVSFEVAKLLKEKGFDWPCICYYEDNGIIHKALDYVRQNDGDDDDNDECLCPTQQMACDWLEEWGIIVEIGDYSVDTNGNPHYGWCVLNKKAQYLVFRGQYYEDSRNEAVEAALKYALTKLI